MAPITPLSHHPLKTAPSNSWAEAFAILIFVIVVFSIVNAVYIAYSEGRAAGQREWMRASWVPNEEEGEYHDYDDSDDTEAEEERRQQALLRRWVEELGSEEEEYDGAGEDGGIGLSSL